MKKKLLILMFASLIQLSVNADEGFNLFKLHLFHDDTRAIKSFFNTQVKYANKTNFNKFISTFSDDYVNGDGFDLSMYSKLVKEVWETYDKIEYGVKIKDIAIKDDTAIVKVIETSSANIPVSQKFDGVLKSESDTVYYLKKLNDRWKVSRDEVLTENTTMLYGDAKDLDLKLTAPEEIKAGEEYTASLEFIPPENVIAIASIASDIVEYPQKQPKEVFRRFPEDNILERLFVANTDNKNEYIVASVGLTKADIEDLSIKLSLTGFGYKIVRVNVIPQQNEGQDVKSE